MAGGEPRELGDLDRENRLLARRLARMQENVRRLEAIQDANSTLLTRLLADLEKERARSRALLLNVLPSRIVDRLEAGESSIADRHESVTVLFSDFVGFTEIAAGLSPSALVEDLNRLFREFDAICERAGVEKIKTIGDAYLVVGGLGGEEDHPAAVAETALQMLESAAAVTGLAASWQLRIGIHIGPVIAGVVGTSKFAFDIWGDTVNIASRLETSSEPGRIQVSAEVALQLAGRYLLHPRGSIEIKGKGPMETFYLGGLATA